MPLFRSATADSARRHALVWACSALLFVALASLNGAFENPVKRFVAGNGDAYAGSPISGDREAPPQRLADECTESLKRRRVCADWLAVAIGPEPVCATATLASVPAIEGAAQAALSNREPLDGVDAFRVEPHDWSSMRLRVCLGRAPPIA